MKEQKMSNVLTAGELQSTYFRHVPSAGLQPADIDSDRDLIRELVVRSRISYYGFECLAKDRAPDPVGLRNRSPFTLTTDTDSSAPSVSARDLMAEIAHRAQEGSVDAADFISIIGRPQQFKNDMDLEVAVHDRVREHLVRPDGYLWFWRDLHRGHSLQDFAAVKTSSRPALKVAGGPRLDQAPGGIS